jgi:hypothetical protein
MNTAKTFSLDTQLVYGLRFDSEPRYHFGALFGGVWCHAFHYTRRNLRFKDQFILRTQAKSKHFISIFIVTAVRYE